MFEDERLDAGKRSMRQSSRKLLKLERLDGQAVKGWGGRALRSLRSGALSPPGFSLLSLVFLLGAAPGWHFRSTAAFLNSKSCSSRIRATIYGKSTTD